MAAVPGCSGGDDEVAGPELTARDFEFQPPEFLVTAGQQVTITFVNRGAVTHNLSIPSIPVDLDFEAGKRGTVIFVPPNEPGGVEFFCKFHADQGMRGTFRVQA
ncbi:MAG TPA: cupredoxin domain-containing protein [Acidimicrobiales bacterium]|nr:cupredoxin domain-containing protein [Acidimicrobiales bacterium]